ncbi:unnamed protein product [Arctia plantaginis]|uniref:Uncharacterized protein n=1 Tax=Arctia plantaginis TaxID=874455 RepID=A0A8S1ACJ4_ARCPL|nr:unnamed protein product [Arctia plantaginis]
MSFDVGCLELALSNNSAPPKRHNRFTEGAQTRLARTARKPSRHMRLCSFICECTQTFTNITRQIISPAQVEGEEEDVARDLQRQAQSPEDVEGGLAVVPPAAGRRPRAALGVRERDGSTRAARAAPSDKKRPEADDRLDTPTCRASRATRPLEAIRRGLCSPTRMETVRYSSRHSYYVNKTLYPKKNKEHRL